MRMSALTDLPDYSASFAGEGRGSVNQPRLAEARPQCTRPWEIELSTQCKKRGSFVDTASSRARPGGRHEVHGAGEPAHLRPMLYRLARGVAHRLGQVRAFVAGFLIGLSVWTPVFFATAAEETEWQQYGLPGGLAMFSAGVWLRLGRSSRPRQASRPRDPAGPSLPSMNRLPA
jgi:hypothetical protein